ncbi:DUF6452 family protein [Flavobacterium algicola]|uniref:DUF6452 family protein n=1 Tax=Flavobacterium algicola TaxID=556529 RepID=UPI001EFC7571|nr:DUF6452 family protein [Flavobacterium algicola]MCG9793453.1 DUF6452 family protein [Flavobacterium algicola]
MKYILIVLLAISATFSSCEKDDICDANTNTTPLMIIDFYDFNDPSTLKSVTDLTIIEEGMTEGVTYSSSTLINGSTVSIPLKTTADNVKYKFILNYENEDPLFVNEDDIEFFYARTEIFISRACGYAINYELTQTNPFELSDGPASDQKWIQEVVVLNRSITNEYETHIQIYH